LVKDGYKFTWQDLIRKPVNEFLSRYFFGKGYKDGLHGLALAGLQGFSEFVMYLKIWQIEKFSSEKADLKEVIEEIRVAQSDMHYWQSDALYKQYGGMINRLRRKLKI
jgi:hypothetical protein